MSRDTDDPIVWIAPGVSRCAVDCDRPCCAPVERCACGHPSEPGMRHGDCLPCARANNS